MMPGFGGWRKPAASHWHVIVREGDKEPRVVTVRSREHAELEATLEGKIPDGVRLAFPFRDVKIAACGDSCLDSRR